jgi:hypothetical protein
MELDHAPRDDTPNSEYARVAEPTSARLFTLGKRRLVYFFPRPADGEHAEMFMSGS